MEFYTNKKFKDVPLYGKNIKIPLNWSFNKAISFIDVRDGTHDSPKILKEGIPFITSKNLINGKVNFNNVNFISNEDSRIINKRSKVSDGDILISMIGSIGNTVFIEDKNPLFSIKNICLFKNNNIDNMKYIYYSMISENIKKQYQRVLAGGVQSFINLTNMRGIKIPLPSLSEQNKIVEAINPQENLVENLEKLIALEENKTTYLRQETLSGNLRVDENNQFYKNKDWKEVVANGQTIQIPEDWEVDTIANKVNFIKGMAISEKDLNSNEIGHKYLKTTEIWMDSASKRETLYFEGDVEEKYLKTKKDYVFSLDGFNTSVGKGTLGLVSRDGVGVVSTHFYKIKQSEVSDLFVNILKSHFIQSYIINLGEGTTVKSANKYLKKIECIFPSDNEEAKRLSTIFLTQADKILNLKEQLIAEKQKLKYLKQELMSGRVRVK